MEASLEKKYKQKGWELNKTVPFNDEQMIKDTVIENSVSKKSKVKKTKLYKYEVEYRFGSNWAADVNKKIEYKIFEVEAFDKSDAKKKFDKWNNLRRRELKRQYIDGTKVWKCDYGWVMKDMVYFNDPEYFTTLIDIRKAK
jgi:hypothetical protein